jgi:hypothetical protein
MDAAVSRTELKNNSRHLPLGEVAVVAMPDQRPMFGVIVARAKDSASAKIVERDPIWFGCVVRHTEAIIRPCTGVEAGPATIAKRYGLTVSETAMRCPGCGTKNLIARLDTGMCLECAMRGGK